MGGEAHGWARQPYGRFALSRRPCVRRANARFGEKVEAADTAARAAAVAVGRAARRSGRSWCCCACATSCRRSRRAAWLSRWTVDHASRAPVCGVGLGRLAGVLGESVWPQPFARLAGSIQRTSLLFIIIMLGPRTTVLSSGAARSKRVAKSSKVEWIGFALFWNLLSGNMLAVLRNSLGRPEFNNHKMLL